MSVGQLLKLFVSFLNKMTTSHSAEDYKELYNYLISKNYDLSVVSAHLEAQATHIEQSSNLMRMRITNLVDQLQKVDELTNNSITPTTTLETLKKLESLDQSVIDKMIQIDNLQKEGKIEEATKLLPNTDIPEMIKLWTPHNDSLGVFLASLKANINYTHDINSYKDLKRKVDDYQVNDFLAMGLAIQEAETKKKKKVTETGSGDVNDITKDDSILETENENEA